MTPLNTSKIEGYETMTADQKLAALENLEIDYSGYVSKETFDKVAKDLSLKKKELEATRTEEERKKAEQDEQFKAMAERLQLLETEKAMNSYTSEFQKLGLDDNLAHNGAKALHENDVKTLFETLTKFKETLKSTVVANEFGKTALPVITTQKNTNNTPHHLTPAEVAARKLKIRNQY